MEFKGTKGVWEINPRASRNVRCGNITIANCSSGQNGDNEEDEKFNAKLIASAPEMFKELVLHLNTMDNGTDSYLRIKKLLNKTIK